MAELITKQYHELGQAWERNAELAQKRIYMGKLSLYKHKDGAYCFEKAAQCFRIARRFKDAGAAYKRGGALEQKLSRTHIAASFYLEAAEQFSKDDPNEAIKCYRTAINMYCQEGQFFTAARLQLRIAKMHEMDRSWEEAMLSYKKAEDFFRTETNCVLWADRCTEKVAYYAGMLGKYEESADLYEEVGYRCLDHNLLKFNARSFFLRALLALIAIGAAAECSKRIRRYQKAEMGFTTSVECMFVRNLLSIREEGDVNALADHIYNYDNVSKLDAWCLRMLLIMKKYLEEKAALLAAEKEKILEKRKGGATKKTGQNADAISIEGEESSEEEEGETATDEDDDESDSDEVEDVETATDDASTSEDSSDSASGSSSDSDSSKETRSSASSSSSSEPEQKKTR